MTYTQLKADIADYLHRTDLTDKIPLFIRLAEVSLFRVIDVKEIETKEDGTTYDDYADLPSDFDSLVKVTIPLNGKEIMLTYGAEAAPGGVVSYSFDENQLRIWNAGTGQAYTIYYKAKMQAVGSGSNWLLINGYDLYLYAAALEGAKYLKDQAEIAALSVMVSGLTNDIKSKINRKMIPSAGGLQIKPYR